MPRLRLLSHSSVKGLASSVQTPLPRAVSLLAVAVLVSVTQGRAQKAVSDLFNFGSIDLKAPLEHTFEFQNDRSEGLEVKDVQLTAPLTVTRMTSRVEPGKLGQVTVRMGTPRPKGEFKGFVGVRFKNQDLKPLYFWVVGRVAAAIEFEPFAAFFLSTQRGEAKTRSIVITNHEPEPLKILEVKHSSSRFTTHLETLEPGRRYRLTLKVKAEAPAGTESEVITLNTSSPEHPILEVKANVKVHERVYTFPDEVDLEISTTALKARPQMVGSLAQELTVYQKGGTNFQILSAETDVPFLRLTPYQAHLKDRFGIKIEVIPEKLKAGEVNGSILIATNDPQFPKITVPVTAIVQGSW